MENNQARFVHMDLADLKAELDAINAAIREEVVLARLANRQSWAEIGRDLGISKQAAQQKYGPYVKPEREKPVNIEDLPLSDPIFDPLFNQPKEPAKPTALVDEDHAGQSVTPSIFLEPKEPADDNFQTKLAKAHATADRILAAERLNPKRKATKRVAQKPTDAPRTR